MKVVIFAGGFGSRLGRLTETTPKPMIKLLKMPIICHIMKYYSYYGYNDFLILSGYKSKVIEKYFRKNKKIFTSVKNKKWKINVVYTGLNTMTGGRLKRVENILKNEENFFLTYGDGLSNVNLNRQLNFHKTKKKIATVLGVHPPARFGSIKIRNNLAIKFEEKPLNNTDSGWINGGFFILSNKVFKYLANDQTVWERKPLEKLSKERQLAVFKHEKFWMPMDTVRDKKDLEKLIKLNKAPWIKW